MDLHIFFIFSHKVNFLINFLCARRLEKFKVKQFIKSISKRLVKILAPNYLTLDISKYAIFIKEIENFRAPKKSLLNRIEMKSTNCHNCHLRFKYHLSNYIIDLFMADIQEISRNQNPTPALATRQVFLLKKGGIPLLPPVGQRSILVTAMLNSPPCLHVAGTEPWPGAQGGRAKRQCWRRGRGLEGRERVRGEGAGKAKCPWKDLEHCQLGAGVM